MTSKPSSEQIRTWAGPAIFSFGFRPFFLFGAIWVIVAMLIWIAVFAGLFSLPSHLDPVSWHAHEFLFGYLGAIMAGFLLTAVPNWTGRLPIVGWRLAALFALWCAGRLAILTSETLPVWLAPSVDIAFPLVLGGLILQEIIAGKNWRNLIVLGLLASFTLGNILFHVEAITAGHAAQGYGLRLGLATAVMMISVIGGRIIPSFTRNWLVSHDRPKRPTPPMQLFDKIVLLASLVILLLWVIAPDITLTAILLLAFGLLHTARLIRWQGHHTLSEPLIWILHVSYAFVPLGAIALATDTLTDGVVHATAQHVWMAGAIAAMTLAVMTRATLGHTGQPLVANKVTIMIYLSLFASIAMRLLSSSFPQLITISGLFWIAAFAGFAISYGPLLFQPKPQARQ
jgi:uncharacterized protein involved in response to NO